MVTFNHKNHEKCHLQAAKKRRRNEQQKGKYPGARIYKDPYLKNTLSMFDSSYSDDYVPYKYFEPYSPSIEYLPNEPVMPSIPLTKKVSTKGIRFDYN